jgi:hypothetical protein
LTDLFYDFDDNESFDDLQFEYKSTDDKLVELRQQLKKVEQNIEYKYDNIMRIMVFNNVNMIIMEIILSSILRQIRPIL